MTSTRWAPCFLALGLLVPLGSACDGGEPSEPPRTTTTDAGDSAPTPPEDTVDVGQDGGDEDPAAWASEADALCGAAELALDESEWDAPDRAASTNLVVQRLVEGLATIPGAGALQESAVAAAGTWAQAWSVFAATLIAGEDTAAAVDELSRTRAALEGALGAAGATGCVLVVQGI